MLLFHIVAVFLIPAFVVLWLTSVGPNLIIETATQSSIGIKTATIKKVHVNFEMHTEEFIVPALVSALATIGYGLQLKYPIVPRQARFKIYCYRIFEFPIPMRLYWAVVVEYLKIGGGYYAIPWLMCYVFQMLYNTYEMMLLSKVLIAIGPNAIEEPIISFIGCYAIQWFMLSQLWIMRKYKYFK